MPDNHGRWINPTISYLEDLPTRQAFDSLTEFLGGWEEVGNGYAMLVIAGAGSALGNGNQSGFWRLQGDWCDYFGVMQLGSTSSFGTPPAAINIRLPFQSSAAYSRVLTARPIGRAFAGNVSNGQQFSGDAYASTVPGNFAKVWGGTQPGSDWNIQAVSGSNVPFGEFWASGDYVTWQIGYRIEPRVGP